MKERIIDPSVIEKMYYEAFHKKNKHIGIQKLSGGLKNRVYLLDDGKTKLILKVEPVNDKLINPLDKNTLWWEAQVLQELEPLDIKIPKVLFYSDGIKDYPYPFLLMSYIDGNNYLNCKDNLTKASKEDISFNIGLISKKICSNKKDYYFLPSLPNKHFSNNYEFVYYLFNSLLKIYNKHNINIDGITKDNILDLLNNKKKELNSVKEISMCNIDLWDGNILVKEGHINGIVDFNDTFYCDELMSFYFHPTDKKYDEYFLLGYGKKNLKSDEKVRIEIYRLYVFLKMIVDSEIRNYGRFSKIYTEFIKIYNKLLII